jgi:hypothetical protein
MNFRTAFARGAILPVACAVACPGARAAPVTRTYSYLGTVANACSLSAPSVTVNASRSGSQMNFSTSPASVTAGCNAAAGGTLSVSSTRLSDVAVPANTKNYTLSVAGWNASSFTYNTTTLPAATTQSKTGAGNSTLTFTCTSGCTQGNLSNNTAYVATVTLGLAPNP